MDSTEELIELLASNPNAAKIAEQTMHERAVHRTPFGDVVISPPRLVIEPLPDDFRSLEPGTNLWSRYWKMHPEKQERMVEWKELLEGGLFSHA